MLKIASSGCFVLVSPSSEIATTDKLTSSLTASAVTFVAAWVPLRLSIGGKRPPGSPPGRCDETKKLISKNARFAVPPLRNFRTPPLSTEYREVLFNYRSSFQVNHTLVICVKFWYYPDSGLKVTLLLKILPEQTIWLTSSFSKLELCNMYCAALRLPTPDISRVVQL